MPERATGQDLLGWAETLSGIARTGLGFTESLYEKERYEEILKVAAHIRGAVTSDPDINAVVDEWMRMVGTGVSGYVTPKSAVGAVVSNEKNEILLVQRADSGVWLYPTGWADIGYSPVEVAIKEVYEETGIHCEPLSLISIVDGMRQGFTRIPLYSMVFHCRAIGGELQSHPLETSDVGWFSRDSLPEPLAGLERWVDNAFDAIEGQTKPVEFDPPRSLPWEEEPN
ncbi:MAG TPA: NUDIX domain-containing protein [Acidimicrobiia bacterium]|jgi:ADP-ribose pyrophosphatase YjhB (NUDIX family)|nr:NUDIX domain-containing protein [Acidimicrobiia bacterium]HIL04441.1 NUDIX domain-containing protein [Acidimicrobiia bacterium]